MNKARRHELKMLHYNRRLKKLRIIPGNGNYFAFRSHGKPCSCGMCSYQKYSRAMFKRELNDALQEVVEIQAGRMEAKTIEQFLSEIANA